MTARLTDEQLAHVAMRIVEDQPKCHACNGGGFKGTHRGERPCAVCDGTGFFALGTQTIRSIIAELRDLRALLATPWPERDEWKERWAVTCKTLGDTIGERDEARAKLGDTGWPARVMTLEHQVATLTAQRDQAVAERDKAVSDNASLIPGAMPMVMAVTRARAERDAAVSVAAEQLATWFDRRANKARQIGRDPDWLSWVSSDIRRWAQEQKRSAPSDADRHDESAWIPPLATEQYIAGLTSSIERETTAAIAAFLRSEAERVREFHSGENGDYFRTMSECGDGWAAVLDAGAHRKGR